MAIYHLSVKPLSRKDGRSATAAIAYRAGEKIHDLTSDQVFDYTRKRGVEHTEIVLPTAMAKLDVNWARDRQALWNAAEMAEKRKDSRVAREYEVALPHELKAEQRVALVRAFAAELSNRYGVAVDFAIHAPHRHGDGRNHHAHIMTTTREVTATGLGRKSDIELGDRDRAKKGLAAASVEIESIRERWAALTNEHLLEQGVKARVDHRSLEDQGITRVPTTHLGPAVSALERRGVETEVGKRIAWQRAELAQERLERAAELGKIERERAQVERSILDLSGDVGSARRGHQIKTPERVTGDRLTRSTQRLAEQLKELGPLSKGPEAKPASPAVETPALLMPSDRSRRGGQDWPLGQAPESAGSDATRQPAPRPNEAARERERLAAMNSRELWAEIQKIRPPSVDRLVELDPSVVGARGTVERHQREAAQALETANRAAAQGDTWRQAHGVQAALHDRGMKTAPYLVDRAVAVSEAQRVRAEALKAARIAQAELTLARAEATPRITQETAPARSKVEDLRTLATAADKREQVATEFERLARAAARSVNRDMSQEWQATPKVLRDAIERYNRERPEVQKEILKAIATRPDAAQKLEEAIEVRRAQVHDRDYGLGL